MTMKIISTVLTACFLLTGTGCSDFLQEDLQGTFSSSTFFKTREDALLALTGVYSQAAFVSTSNVLWVFGDVASDDAIKGGAAGDIADIDLIDNFTYSRNNIMLENLWKYYYEGISRTNYVLQRVPEINMDAGLKARILGEAKFLRAYFYFTLVNVFGEVPLKLLPPINAAAINVPKSTVAAVYAQIEKDLLEAKAALPRSYSGADVGRATKGAAWGILAKVRIYNQAWTAALTAIDSLEAAAPYSLAVVYSNNFKDSLKNGAESIFAIQHLSGQLPKLGTFLNQYFAPAKDNGYYFNVPLQNFVNEFEVTSGSVNDPRLDYTVGRSGKKWVNGENFDPLWSPTGYLQRKHVQPVRQLPIIGDGNLNYVYLRYADILLMKAEALNESGQTSAAMVPLNAVRKRARESYLNDPKLPGFGVIPTGLLPNVSDGGQAANRLAIRHERRVELGFEFHRYFDLARYGQQAAEAALAGTTFTYSKRYFLIPQSELDTNPEINN
ncbi:MAG: RagB/SusD family nutrient uptake outer membrane protein [Cytophagales bacterium]|nr:RagB/SusD family nutrient uptake outer membrane protein [Cytophagales bacterium]